MGLLYIYIFAALLLLGMPMVYLMLFAPGLALYIDGQEVFFNLLFQRLFNGIDNFPLMALPFFILAGELMTAGGITARIVRFADSMVGHVKGGLGHVCVCSSVMLSGGCGSPVADASALGAILIPAMEKKGYSLKFASAITAASAVIVGIIPPSGIFILYAFIMNVSVAAMFAAGIIPGFMVAFGLMLMIAFLSKFKAFPKPREKASMAERYGAFKSAFLSLMTPVILIGGILGGMFTPTEAAAAAAAYTLVLGLFHTKEIAWKNLPAIFSRAALNSAIILMLVGAAVAFASVVSLKGTPKLIGDMIITLTDNVILLFFLINILLLLIGTFMDAGPAILILAPILAPVMINLGIDPIHFAVVMSVNLIIGLITPPMGLVLFVVAGISREKIESIVVEMLPFFLVEVAILFIITYFPSIVLFLPQQLGLI